MKLVGHLIRGKAMASKRTYAQFKSLVHNDMGITKESIRTWIKEAISEEARKMIEHSHEDFDLNRLIKREILNTDAWDQTRLSPLIAKQIGIVLADRLSVQVKADKL